MASIFRVILGVLTVGLIGLAGLGLFNQYRGLPPGTLDGAREIAKTLTAKLGIQNAESAGTGPLSRDPAHGDSSRSFVRELIGCSGPRDDTADPGTQRSVYAWRDSAGVMNFADSAAAQSDAQALHFPTGNDEFFISVSAQNAVLPGNFEGAIRAGAKRSYAQWRDWLGEEEVVRTHINIRFLGDAEDFAKIYGKANQANWTATGFYRMRSNEAMVLYTPDYRVSALATAFHEMSHLITAWHLGPTPPWLNEGIAEHFETMQLGWQSAEFLPNQQHIALLQAKGPVPLDELTALTRKEWGRRDPLLRYASAWSLVAFLFDSEAGQQTLQRIVQHAREQRCTTRSNLQDALNSFPGGKSKLQAQWYRWVREA